MPKTITFINMKGGVGKTTLAVNVAYGLAYYHAQNILLIDIDPQFNASTYLMNEIDYLDHVKNKKTILDIFRSNATPISLANPVRKKATSSKISLSSCVHSVHSNPGNLDLIPAQLNLMELQMSERGTENRLSRFIERTCGGYDFVIVDCPPTISFFTQAAILASDAYVVPLRPDPLASIGLPLLEKWLEDYTCDSAHELKNLGIILSYIRGPLPNAMREVIDTIRHERGEEVFRSQISERTGIASSVESHLPVFLHEQASSSAKQMLALINEFKERLDGVFNES